ncbi:diguanylate cyclase [Pseudodesulfovibrio indicus]|uniref:diguanylate cyclase n=1 Tax=Pseudodesulfovibrio indicus TaxID=1716143 RepID=UPI00292F61F1|nr:diguanylate cyclase [Pseudodesulfovibrio indicus]
MIARFLFAAILVVLASAGVEGVLEYELLTRSKNEERLAVLNRVSTLRADLEKELIENLSLIYGTANFLSVTPDMDQDKFKQYAKGVFAWGPLLRNLAAAPDFVMAYVYPRAGNEGLIGFDYRTHPEQWPLVQKIMETGRMVVAGPVDLVQGGRGIIGRAPVFVTSDGKRRFWGVVSAVIDTDRLFQKVGLTGTGLRIALRGADGGGEDGEMIFGEETLFAPEAAPVKVAVRFPSGNWLIAAVPGEGWNSHRTYAMEFRLLTTGFVLVILFMLYRGMRKKHILLKTRRTLNEAQTIAKFGSWELDMRSGVNWWSDQVYRLYGVNPEEFEPSLDVLLERIPEEDLPAVKEALEKTRHSREPFSLAHRVNRADGSQIHVRVQGAGEYGPRGRLLRVVGTILDITEQVRAQEALRKEQLKLTAMADASYDAFIMVDARGRILFWSPAAERMYGWNEEEAMGKEIHELIAPVSYHDDAKAGMHRFAGTGTGPVMESIMEFDSLRKDGSILPVERSVSAFKVEGEYYAVGILRDITERKRFLEELTRLARIDSMTGLNNRAYFTELVELELERARRQGHPVCLVMFDADRFKLVNDTYGHDVGDQVLAGLARTVADSMRCTDILGRLGGEEFAALLLDTDLESAKLVAEKMRQVVEDATVSTEDGTVVDFTISLGIAEFSKDVPDLEHLLKFADQALYRAKAEGRNRWVAHGEAAD